MGSILVAAIVSGSIYALVSLGFALAFRISSVFNLAHGILLVTAGYLNYWLAVQHGLSPWISVPTSLALVGALGLTIEAVLIPAAKTAGLKPVDLLLLSWLMLLIVQDVLAIAFESQSIYVGASQVREGWAVFGGRVTPLQALIVATSILVGAALFLIIRRSATGQEVLAVGDDPRLAMICGLNVKKIIGLNAAAAALLTAGAGILMSYQERLDPTLGFRFSVIAIVSTLIGFPLGPAGAVVGAYVLALFETLVLYVVDPGLRDAAVYAGLFLVLVWTYRRSLVPPEG